MDLEEWPNDALAELFQEVQRESESVDVEVEEEPGEKYQASLHFHVEGLKYSTDFVDADRRGIVDVKIIGTEGDVEERYRIDDIKEEVEKRENIRVED